MTSTWDQQGFDELGADDQLRRKRMPGALAADMEADYPAQGTAQDPAITARATQPTESVPVAVSSPGSGGSPAAAQPQADPSTTIAAVPKADGTNDPIEREAMRIMSGMPSVGDMYSQSQSRATDLQKKINDLEHPSLKSRLLRFLPLAAGVGLGAFAGPAGMAAGALLGNQFMAGKGRQRALQYETLNRQIEQERTRGDTAAEKGYSAAGTMARIGEMRDYHQGMVGVRQQMADTAGRKVDLQEEMSLRKAGLAKDPNTGDLRPLDPSEMGPFEQNALAKDKSLIEYRQSAIELNQASKALKLAQNDPSSPTYQLALRRVQSAGYAHQIAAQNAGLKALQWEYAMSGTQGGVPVPGQLTIDGQVIGGKPAQYSTLTARQKDTVSQANSVEALGTDLAAYVRQHKDLFGPIHGRGNIMQQVIGSTDPRYAEFQQKFDSFVALHPKLHDFRGMTAAKMFDKTYGGGIQNADALATAIETGIKSADIIKKSVTGNRGVVPPKSGSSVTGTGTPSGTTSLTAPNTGTGTAKVWSKSQWLAKYPKGDVDSAVTQARQQGFRVVP